MERINGQVIDFKRLANQVLSWIVCAKRPLTTRELQHALAVEVGESEANEQKVPEIEDMVTFCAGLVTVDEESGIIRLVHYTTQEYFEQTQSSWFPRAEIEISTICITYLSFSVFESGFCESHRKLENRLQQNPLYDYAAKNWGYHARAASAEVRHFVKEFLESEVKVSNSYQAMMVFFQYVPMKVLGLHLAAYFGLMETMIDLLKNNACLEFQDDRGWTPLFYAVDNGQEAMIRLLLEKGAKLETVDILFGQTPLSHAAKYGKEAVVQLLLEKGAELETKSRVGRTPLSHSAQYGKEAVVQLLLEKGAELETKSAVGRTPLLYAAWYGSEAVVKLLLEKGAELEVKCIDGRTPLSYAAERRQDVVTKLLLEKGAELESKSTDGRTPLLYAVMRGNEVVVKLLLEKGAELETTCRFSRTPLSYAAVYDREVVAKLLLEKGADPMSKDETGYTPRDYATKKGHERIVKLLSEKITDPLPGSLKRKRQRSQ